MRVRIYTGLVGDSATCATFEVKEAQSIVFIENSVTTRELVARFHDVRDVVHEIPVEKILSIDPDPPFKRVPVRYLDPATGDEVANNAGGPRGHS